MRVFFFVRASEIPRRSMNKINSKRNQTETTKNYAAAFRPQWLEPYHPGKGEQYQYLSKRIRIAMSEINASNPIVQAQTHGRTHRQLIEGKGCTRERPPEHLFIIHIIYLFSIAMHTESMWKCFNSKLLQSIIYLNTISDPIDLANI